MSAASGGWGGCGDRTLGERGLRALERLWAKLHLRDRHRTVALHSRVGLDVGALGLLCCDLALTPAGSAPTLLTVGVVVLVGHDARAALCAAAELPECWRLDVERGWTERLRHPGGGRYRSRELILPGETVAPQHWPLLAVAPLDRAASC
jgi:hypothetical protein